MWKLEKRTLPSIAITSSLSLRPLLVFIVRRRQGLVHNYVVCASATDCDLQAGISKRMEQEIYKVTISARDKNRIE